MTLLTAPFVCVLVYWWQAAIRPRGVHEEHRPLDGGARSVKCALCPIKFGAFKRAEDGQRWVHSVRARRPHACLPACTVCMF